MKVIFSSTHSAFQVKAPAGTLVSLGFEPTEIVDGVYVVDDSGVIGIDEQRNTNTVYLNIDAEDYNVTPGQSMAQIPEIGVQVFAGSSAISYPFKKSGKGGGGSSGADIGIVDDTAYVGDGTIIEE